MSRVADRVDARSPVPAWTVLGAVGAALLAAALLNFGQETREFGLAAGPLVAAAMAVSLAGGVLYASARLRRSNADGAEVWAVTLSALAVGLFVALGYGLTILVRLAEGRSIAEPLFPVVVMGSLGLLAGVVIGWERVERRRVTASVRESRDALAFANSLLRHDVRNALQVVDARSSLLADHEDPDVREAASIIRGQVDSIDTLVAEVRSVTDVLTGDPDPKTVDLAVLLADVLEAAEEGHPGLAVERDFPDELPVHGGEALYAVFRNLVDNAAEHAAEGPVTVTVSGERANGRVSVTVADDGRGVPDADRDSIFERGVSSNGGGQGLYVASTIVDRLGGTMTVEDSDLGGAAFVVELPGADRNTEEVAAELTG